MNLIIEPTDSNKEKGGIWIGNITAAGSIDLIRKNKIRAILTVASGTNLKFSK